MSTAKRVYVDQLRRQRDYLRTRLDGDTFAGGGYVALTVAALNWALPYLDAIARAQDQPEIRALLNEIRNERRAAYDVHKLPPADDTRPSIEVIP